MNEQEIHVSRPWVQALSTSSEKVDSGEIIEIDDGLKPYYFYVLDFATIIPLPCFHF